MPAKKVAAVVTVYRKWSHADVILRHLLNGYPDGTKPDLELVSLYTDQVPKGDMSRDLAKKHGFKIFDNIADCLTLGGKSLAVDAVLSIGEHGDYSTNAKGQILYPRRRFFEEICKVLEKSEKSVPVFSDKHLAATWDDAKWMYDRARKLMLPFMAGSSVPVTWRKPNLVLPKGCELTGAVQIGYGPFEGYGFHALEGLQCMVERRAGGETGVKAVTAHTGQAITEAFDGQVWGLGGPAGRYIRRNVMWENFDKYPWAGQLFDAAVKLVPAHASGDMRRIMAATQDSGVIEIEYRDGLRAFMVMPNGWIHEGDGGGFIFAGQRKGQEKPDACHFYLHGNEPFAHFAELTKAIDSLVRTGHAPYPVERTLLTTGIIEAVMTSRHENGKRIETPHLEIKYTPSRNGGQRRAKSHRCRSRDSGETAWPAPDTTNPTKRTSGTMRTTTTRTTRRRTRQGCTMMTAPRRSRAHTAARRSSKTQSAARSAGGISRRKTRRRWASLGRGGCLCCWRWPRQCCGLQGEVRFLASYSIHPAGRMKPFWMSAITSRRVVSSQRYFAARVAAAAPRSFAPARFA